LTQAQIVCTQCNQTIFDVLQVPCPISERLLVGCFLPASKLCGNNVERQKALKRSNEGRWDAQHEARQLAAIRKFPIQSNPVNHNRLLEMPSLLNGALTFQSFSVRELVPLEWCRPAARLTLGSSTSYVSLHNDKLRVRP